jgi:peptidoglycan/LPS O-acetylase OafA/YrhL
VGHLRSAFFVNLGQLTSHKMLWFGVYALTSLGHQAVIVFFVLSGYLVGGSVIRALRNDDWSWSRYFTHRLVRLWLVLIPALLLGLVWDQIGLHLHAAPLLYSGQGWNHTDRDVADTATLGVLLGNVAFLQSIYFPTFGSNGALWSLANEWWYYVLFPLMACAFAFVRARRNWLLVGVYVILFALVGLLVGRAILVLFPAWLLGALLHFVPGRKRAVRGWMLASSVLLYGLVLCVFALLYFRGIAELGDNLLGIITAVFIWILLADRERARNAGWSRLARSSARFSYTLYVTHLPLMVLCAATLVHDERWNPGFMHWLAALAVLGGILVYAWVVASVTEFRTDQVRGWIESRLWPARPYKASAVGSRLR